MLRKLLFGFLILIVATYAGAEVFGKGYAERKTVENVEQRDPKARDVDATFSSPLVLGLIRKSTVERVEVDATHIDAGDFFTDRAIVVLTGIHVDLGRSIKERKVVVTKIDRLDLSLDITAEEASKTLPSGFAFDFGQDKVAVEGPGGVGVSGNFEVTSPGKVRFVPDSPLPHGFRAPSWDLTEVPMIDCLREIKVRAGKLRATCSVSNPPIDLPPNGASIF